jgi:hypothetical protein
VENRYRGWTTVQSLSSDTGKMPKASLLIRYVQISGLRIDCGALSCRRNKVLTLKRYLCNTRITLQH